MKNWKVHKKQNTKVTKSTKPAPLKKNCRRLYVGVMVALMAVAFALFMGSSQKLCDTLHSIPFVRNIWQHKYCLLVRKYTALVSRHLCILLRYVKNTLCCFCCAVTSRVPILASIAKKVENVWILVSSWMHRNICVHLCKGISCIGCTIDRLLGRIRG